MNKLLTTAAVTAALLGLAGTTQSQNKKTLAFVVNGASDFWKAAEAGVKKAQTELPIYATAYRIAAASHALAGRAEAAAKALAQLLLIDPAARTSRVRDWITLRRPEDYARLEEGLRKAGLPE